MLSRYVQEQGWNLYAAYCDDGVSGTTFVEVRYIPASNVTRDGNEYVLKITKATLNKMLSTPKGAILPVESILIMDNLERIANNGVWFGNKGDKYGRPQVAGYDYLKTTVYIEGAPYEVKMRVRLVEEKPGKGADNVLYYFSPEEILTIERVGTTPPTYGRRASILHSEDGPTLGVGTASPTGERRALTMGSEGMPTLGISIPQTSPQVNQQTATPAGKISDLEVLRKLAEEMASSRTEDLGPDGLVPEISSRPVQQSAQEILSRLAREMTQDPGDSLTALSDEDIKAMLDKIARGQGGEATAGETDISGEADSESDIGDALRNVAKRLAQSGQAVGFAELPRKIRQAFESELVGATPDTQKALQKVYPKTDYILVSGKRSRYVHGPRNVILLSKYAPPSTLAHELFHELDQGYKISRTFIESLMKDYVALNVKSGGDIVGYLRQKFPEAFVKSGIAGEHYLTKQHRGISDIINGLTDGQVFLGYGHKESYWKKADKLEAEAWAQFGRVQFENQADILKMFQSLFPNFYKSAMIALKELI